MADYIKSETVKLFEQMENAVEVVSEEKKEEKPDIEAEDFNMEDYSGDDLSKLKKSKTKDIAKKVPDKQTKDDNMKGHGQANGAVKKTTTIESLHLCNDCCKTFRSVNEKCTLCGSDKTELVIKVNEEEEIPNRSKKYYPNAYPKVKDHDYVRIINGDHKNDIGLVVAADIRYDTVDVITYKRGERATLSFSAVEKIAQSTTGVDKQRYVESKVNENEPFDFDSEKEDYKDDENVVAKLVGTLEGFGFNFSGKRQEDGGFTVYEFSRSATATTDDGMKIEIKVGNSVEV